MNIQNIQELPPINAKAQVFVSADKTMAYLTIIPPSNGGADLMAADILQALLNAGVVFGIQREKVTQLESMSVYSNRELVATASQPVAGSDGYITFHFEKAQAVPKELQGGRVDFKQLDIIKEARKGDVLCTKTPPEEGAPGTNVLGQPIPAKPGKDIFLPAGKNTVISDDGLSLLAGIDGQVDLVNQRVQVNNLFTVDKDVDYSTGNIIFIGNVLVMGNVTPGFEVKAEGNITINGCVDGGVVEAKDNVTIAQGFIGSNSGLIKADGDVKCKFIQNGKVNAKGSVHTGSIINSTVRSGNAVIMSGTKAPIIGSHITARVSIECSDVGKDSALSGATTLEAGSDPHVAERSGVISKEIADMTKRLAGIERMVDLYTKLSEQNRLTPDKKEEFEKLTAARGSVQSQLNALETEKEDLMQRLSSVGFGTIISTGVIRRGTRIVIGSEIKILQSDHTYTRFTRSDDGIETSAAG